jgi:Flp pilus assembly pilin Flp
MRLRAGQLVQDSGQALIEYALILALAALAIISALMILQGSLGNSMQASSHEIDAAAEGRAGELLRGEPADGATRVAGPNGNTGNGNGNRGPDGEK